MAQVGALGAAVMIAVQLTAEHWFYLYIVWFLPMLLLALCFDPSRRARPRGPPPAAAAVRRIGSAR